MGGGMMMPPMMMPEITEEDIVKHLFFAAMQKLHDMKSQVVLQYL